jgi:hypothetical protein
MINIYNKMPRSVLIIKKQLADLTEVKASANYDVEFDSATKAEFAFLEVNENELIEELKAAEWLENQSDMEFVLDGSSVVNHSIPITVLGKFFDQVQKLRRATAEIAIGNVSARGRFSNDIINQNELLVNCFIPSSFAIHLTYTNDYLKNSLFKSSKERPGESYFLALLSGDSENFTNELSKNNISTRINSYYQDFLSFLTDYNLTIFTRTKNHPFAVKITPENARNRKELLNFKYSELNEDEIYINGILIMGDIQKNNFAIKDETTIYRGQVTKDGAVDLMNFTLGSKVQARILVTTFPEDLAKPSYSLLSLNSILD